MGKMGARARSERVRGRAGFVYRTVLVTVLVALFVVPVAAVASPVAEAASQNCDPNYSPCIPDMGVNALNCGDIGVTVRVLGIDHNKFDQDGDGI